VGGAEDLSRQLWGVLCFTLWVDGHRQAATAEATARAGTARA
jgi:hypothetical protein